MGIIQLIQYFFGEYYSRENIETDHITRKNGKIHFVQLKILGILCNTNRSEEFYWEILFHLIPALDVHSVGEDTLHISLLQNTAFVKASE